MDTGLIELANSQDILGFFSARGFSLYPVLPANEGSSPNLISGENISTIFVKKRDNPAYIIAPTRIRYQDIREIEHSLGVLALQSNLPRIRFAPNYEHVLRLIGFSYHFSHFFPKLPDGKFLAVPHSGFLSFMNDTFLPARPL